MLRPICGFLLLACTFDGSAQGPDRSTETPNPVGHTAEAVAQGRKLYNTSCTMCHGLDGTAGDRAPALAGGRRFLRSTNDQLFDAIKKGIPGTNMPPTPLPDTNVWQIVAYIRSLRATAADEFVEGNVQHGLQIFNGKGNCAKCHMVRGQGGLLGPDLSNVASERSLKALRDSLTKPRPTIPRGYQPVRLTTTEGKQIDGIVKNENNFSLQVMDHDYKIHLLLRSELRDVTYEKQSLMPRNYHELLDAGELQDLLAYLSKQSRGGGTQATGAGGRRSR